MQKKTKKEKHASRVHEFQGLSETVQDRSGKSFLQCAKDKINNKMALKGIYLFKELFQDMDSNNTSLIVLFKEESAAGLLTGCNQN